jgi:hypothetical protein
MFFVVQLITTISLQEIPFAYTTVFMLIIIFLQYVKFVSKSTEKILSPISLFISVFYLYTIMGIFMWIYREIFAENWSGKIYFVTNYFFLTALFLMCFAVQNLSHYPNRKVLFTSKQWIIKQRILIILILLGYWGAYVVTKKFSAIPLLTDDIDATRFSLSEDRNIGEGGAFAGIMILFGTITLQYLLFSRKYNKWIRIILLIFSYIPFLFYSGRLNIAFPVICILVVYLLKANYKINIKNVFLMIVTIIVLFSGMMLYGAYRRQANNNMEKSLVIDFITADLFPEYRGAVAIYNIDNEDLSIPLFSAIIVNSIPGSLTNRLGLNKNEQLNMGFYIAEKFGITGYGIRTSLAGELLLTNPLTFILFWYMLLYYIKRLNKSYFEDNHISLKKVICIILAIFSALIIPYGTTILHVLFGLSICLYLFYQYMKRNINISQIQK